MFCEKAVLKYFLGFIGKHLRNPWFMPVAIWRTRPHRTSVSLNLFLKSYAEEHLFMADSISSSYPVTDTIYWDLWPILGQCFPTLLPESFTRPLVF